MRVRSNGFVSTHTAIASRVNQPVSFAGLKRAAIRSILNILLKELLHKEPSLSVITGAVEGLAAYSVFEINLVVHLLSSRDFELLANQLTDQQTALAQHAPRVVKDKEPIEIEQFKYGLNYF